MYAQMFAGSSLVILPLIALAVFVIVFLAAVVRVLGRGAAAYDEAARLPFDSAESPHE